MLAALEAPDAGIIRWEAQDDRSAADPGKGRVSMVFQEDRLIEEADAATNVLLAAPHLTRAEAERELGKLLPAESLGQPVRELSGGMRRRVALVRACSSDADVYLMDEPLTGLDADNRAAALGYLLEKTAGRQTIVTAHEPLDPERFRTVFVPEITPEITPEEIPGSF